MAKIIMTFLLGLSCCMVSHTAKANDGDLLPWPWGSECPFNWKTFNGRWNIKSNSVHDSFEFAVLSKSPNGDRYFEIRRYDSEHDLVAKGTGYSEANQRIIRAAMYEIAGWSSYWVIVRSYDKDYSAHPRQKHRLSCNVDSRVTVLTIRPIEEERETKKDVHYIIERDGGPVEK